MTIWTSLGIVQPKGSTLRNRSTTKIAEIITSPGFLDMKNILHLAAQCGRKLQRKEYGGNIVPLFNCNYCLASHPDPHREIFLGQLEVRAAGPYCVADAFIWHTSKCKVAFTFLSTVSTKNPASVAGFRFFCTHLLVGTLGSG